MNSRTDFFYYMFRNILLVGIPLLAVFTLLLSISPSSARISSNDSLSISVPSSCTLSSSVDEAHDASIINGTYESGIGKTTLTTFCNDKNGYVIYAIGNTLDNEGNNVLASSAGSSSDIVSGTAESGNTSNWAMKLANIANDPSPTPPIISSPFNTYSTVPTTWTKVASITSGTTDMSQGSSLTTTYAVYISPTQSTDTYTGQVKYLLTHPSSSPVGKAYIMQEIAEWKDELPNSGDSVQAIDIRDGKSYWVTRLADGHIWMTQNLDFDIVANSRLSSETTDLNVIYNGQYAEYDNGYYESNGNIYWEPASSAATISFTGTGNTAGQWVNSATAPASAKKTDDTNEGHTSIGNYYNWNAAIASNDSSTLTSETLNNISSNPKNSICPKGWRLPTVSNENASNTNSTNEFARLIYLYGNDLTIKPLWFVKSGNIFTNSSLSLVDYGTTSYYFSSTIRNANLTYGLYANGPTSQSTYDFGNKSRGKPIRCLAK